MRATPFLLLVLAACEPPSKDAEPTRASDITVEVDALVPTLVRVAWDSDVPVRGRVVWFVGGKALGGTTLDEEGTAHATAFLGIPAGETATIELRHAFDSGDEEIVASVEVELEPAPSWLPEVIVELAPEAPPTPYVFVAMEDIEVGRATLQVIDWQGRPVWWRPEEPGANAFADPREGGFTYTRGVPPDDDLLVRIGWDGASEVVPVPGVHHEVHERADGSVGVCRSEKRELDGEMVGADTLSVVSPDGSVRDLWSGFDSFSLERGNRCDGLMLPDGTRDGTHCNGLSYDEAEETWLVSLYCMSAVLAISDATGEVAWTLGGDDATIESDAGARFDLQHAPRGFPGGLRLFDNGDAATGSRVVDIAVDPDLGTARLVKAWAAPEGEYTPVLGAAEGYGDGVLASFGVTRTLYWLGPDGGARARLSATGPNVVSTFGGVADMPL